jgi:hypothetical protein
MLSEVAIVHSSLHSSSWPVSVSHSPLSSSSSASTSLEQEGELLDSLVPTPTTYSTPQGVLPPIYLHIPRLINIEEYKSFSRTQLYIVEIMLPPQSAAQRFHFARISPLCTPRSGFIPSRNQTSEFSDYIAFLVSVIVCFYTPYLFLLSRNISITN